MSSIESAGAKSETNAEWIARVKGLRASGAQHGASAAQHGERAEIHGESAAKHLDEASAARIEATQARLAANNGAHRKLDGMEEELKDDLRRTNPVLAAMLAEQPVKPRSAVQPRAKAVPAASKPGCCVIS